MASEIERFLTNGSRFVPEVSQDVVNRILADITGEEKYKPGEAIAKWLIALWTELWPSVLRETLERNGEFTPDEFRRFSHGFLWPLQLLVFSYGTLEEGIDAARLFLRRAKADSGWQDEARPFVLANLEYGLGSLRKDLSGKTLIDDLARRETTTRADTYYSLGLDAACRYFAAYWDQLTDLGFGAGGRQMNDLSPHLKLLVVQFRVLEDDWKEGFVREHPELGQIAVIRAILQAAEMFGEAGPATLEAGLIYGQVAVDLAALAGDNQLLAQAADVAMALELRLRAGGGR